MRISALLLAAGLFTACNNAGCTDNQSSLPLAKFYSMETKQPVAIDSLDIGGVGAVGDSLLYQAGMHLTEVFLPFRSASPTTSFYFHYAEKRLADPANNDTITFEYVSWPYFASEDCGAMFRYRITHMEHTRHLIDSVAILDSIITNTDRQRLSIYFRTRTAEEDVQ